MIAATYIDTPLGRMIAAATDTGICLFDFDNRRNLDGIKQRIAAGLKDVFEEVDHPHFVLLRQQADEYFSGSRKKFSVPLHIIGTPFQQRVWQALQDIDYGITRSYKQQSLILGNLKAIRAVAKANGDNGISIIIPCHRVIGDTGHLIGYGGGLERKKWLLDHEAKHANKVAQLPLFA